MYNCPELWRDRVLEKLQIFCEKHQYFLAEEATLFCIASKTGEPNHPNAWGAMWNIIVQKGWIELTHSTENASSPKNHGSRYNVWKSKLFKQ